MADENQATATEKFIPPSIAAFNAVSEDSAKEVTPRSFGVMATPMGELAKAGVSLAQFVMWMISGAVAILILMALISESREITASSKIAELILAAPLSSSAPAPEDKQLSGVVSVLRQAAANPALVLPPVEIENARMLIDKALKMPAITSEQKSSLDKKCIPLPPQTVKDRATVLERCAATLGTVFVSPTPDVQRLAVIKELQKSQAEESIARRAFWMQAAQLVLINLLLPILTALLGYIFGTRQAS
jgi:hypothetical protein